ncbi:MAG: DNA polymerase, partial [Candidatus Electrothrix sp.]
MQLNPEELSAIDVETEPTVKTEMPYALEPWRVKQGKARISCATIDGIMNDTIEVKDGDVGKRLADTLNQMEDKYVICHNALFDVAWMLAEITKHVGDFEIAYSIINKVHWLDSSLLSKWLENGQKAEDKANYMSHALIAVCNRHIPDHPRMDEFNDVKFQTVKPGQDYDYWLKRNKLDTELTLEVFKVMWNKLPEPMRIGFLIEQKTIAPISKGWLHGIPFDDTFATELHKKLESHKIRLCKEIGVTVACLSSPKQKQKLIFQDWGIVPLKLTPSGAPSTAHDVLVRIHQKTQDPKFDKLMAAIKLSTIQSKYTNGFARTRASVGEPTLYGSPRIFGTYTGRMTYKNKTTKKQEHQCSIALHQVPRKAKSIKHCMKIPEGYALLAIDANSQE